MTVFMNYFDNPGGMIPTWLVNWAAKVRLALHLLATSTAVGVNFTKSNLSNVLSVTLPFTGPLWIKSNCLGVKYYSVGVWLTYPTTYYISENNLVTLYVSSVLNILYLSMSCNIGQSTLVMIIIVMILSTLYCLSMTTVLIYSNAFWFVESQKLTVIALHNW